MTRKYKKGRKRKQTHKHKQRGGEGGNTDLLEAADSGDTDKVKDLLKGEVDVNAKDDDGMTALMLAAMDGNTEMVTALSAVAGIDGNVANDDGWTALMYAAMDGHTATVTALSAVAGIDVNAVNDDGWTALMYAAMGGHTETMIALLAVAGINTAAKDKTGLTALSMALDAEIPNWGVVAAVGGLEEEATTSIGGELRLAAWKGDLETVKKLLDGSKGAFDRDAKGDGKKTGGRNALM